MGYSFGWPHQCYNRMDPPIPLKKNNNNLPATKKRSKLWDSWHCISCYIISCLSYLHHYHHSGWNFNLNLDLWLCFQISFKRLHSKVTSKWKLLHTQKNLEIELQDGLSEAHIHHWRNDALALKCHLETLQAFAEPLRWRYPPRDKRVFSFVIKIYSKDLPVTY